MRRIFASIICLFALALPYRARTLFTEFLGWVWQSGYFVTFKLTRFIIKNLEK